MMDNNPARRHIAHVGILGTAQLHPRNPYITAWWSAAFPGLGHLLLGKNIHGFFLFIWEVVVNIQAGINLAIIYSFQGNFQMVTQVVDTRWLLAYMPVYLFGIWDCYRTTIDINKLYILADYENRPFSSFSMNAAEINLLSKRNPVMALIWSFAIPGLGQLYVSRFIPAFVLFFWTAVFLYKSQVLSGIKLMLATDTALAVSVIEPAWLLFLPSLYGGAAFDAYVNAKERNKLFAREQRQFLNANYQRGSFKVIHKQKKR